MTCSTTGCGRDCRTCHDNTYEWLKPYFSFVCPSCGERIRLTIAKESKEQQECLMIKDGGE